MTVTSRPGLSMNVQFTVDSVEYSLHRDGTPGLSEAVKTPFGWHSASLACSMPHRVSAYDTATVGAGKTDSL